VWRDDPVSWQPAGTRRWWQRERLAPAAWGIGRRRLPAHRCSSCQRYWFNGVFLEL